MISKESGDDKLRIKIYTDGSYISTHKDIYGFSAVLILKDENIVVYGSYKGHDVERKRNIGGEIDGVLRGIEYTLQHFPEVHEIQINHDYIGVGHWANKTWKRNLDYTQEYSDLIDEFRNKVAITFNYVPAHSNIKYNVVADKYAKDAIMQRYLLDDEDLGYVINTVKIS